jgi:uncharacterized protein YuzE
MDTRRDVYVALTGGQSVKQRTFHDQIIFDLDAENNIIGVEILNARSVTADGKALVTEWAVRQGHIVTPFADEETAHAMVVAMRHPPRRCPSDRPRAPQRGTGTRDVHRVGCALD